MKNDSSKRGEKRSKKLFGVPADQLKLVTGGGGVIIMSPTDETDGGVIIQKP
jgi:hypothetical protein